METSHSRPRMYKVLTPITRGGEKEKTFWMRVGTAFPAKGDASALNLYLDVLPKGEKAMLHIREMDEEDLQPRGRRDRRHDGPLLEDTSPANDLPF